ncbi:MULTISPECIES: hypothetical protein [Sinorhizobium/Ensifer group]|uniref:Uncharacterized protein n=1 Tax=Sinorhizobium sp. M14 TaxID=430451 RepID=A0A142BPR5_9HYPH|nr:MULTISPECIES: hypothetical protein [Sinorhizobium/Ensifer group]AMP35073.1 hypothetical protein pSinB_214 [Sinorhizobium sp. M14]
MGMFRITLQKMLVLLRLVIVLSLVGYSLPTASAAMHGASPNPEIVQPGDHHEMASDQHSHGDHASSPDDAEKISKQECCKGFCVSMAIVAHIDMVGGPRVAPIREFIDDVHVIGQLPALHRPPNI